MIPIFVIELALEDIAKELVNNYKDGTQIRQQLLNWEDCIKRAKEAIKKANEVAK